METVWDGEEERLFDGVLGSSNRVLDLRLLGLPYNARKC